MKQPSKPVLVYRANIRDVLPDWTPDATKAQRRKFEVVVKRKRAKAPADSP